MKVTLGTAKARIAKHLNLCPTDSRTVEYINEAQRRLLESGKWKGTYGKFTICATNGCITWPRQIETIETVAVNEAVGTVRNQWFEFLESGYGLLDNKDNVGVQILDRGESPVHTDLTGDGSFATTGNNLMIYSPVEADAGKKVTIKGYDYNGNWIRLTTSSTEASATSHDGDIVTLIRGFANSGKIFKTITSIQKDITDQPVTVYEKTSNDGDPLVIREIAKLEADETISSYRRSLIPSLAGGKKCDGDTDGKTSVTVIAKLRFIDAVNDSDILLVSDLYAIKNMAIAIKLEENRDFGAAGEYRGLAFDSLQNQLANHTGDGVVPVIQLTNLNTHGGGGIESLI